MAMDLLLTCTTRWISCLFLVAAIGGEMFVHAVAAEPAALQSLGRLVYLPNVTLQSHHSSAPLIFKNPENVLRIATTYPFSERDMEPKWFESSDEFKQSIAEEMGVEGTAKERSFSVESEFSRVAGSETDVKVVELKAMRIYSKSVITSAYDFKRVPLNEGFMKDFRSLPVLVKDSHMDSAWSPFRDFMSKWGSHVVNEASTGTVYQSWSSASSKLRYSQIQMQAKACLNTEGLKNVFALEACMAYDQSERQDSAKLTTTDTKCVRGGTAETRSKLASSLVTPELLEKFLKESNVDLQPVRYKYLPVWEILRERSDRKSDDYKRALGLQAYYEGWKATGCPLVRTTGQSNEDAQLMVPEYNPSSKQHTGYYLCIRRCAGCHDKYEDCHFDPRHCDWSYPHRGCCVAYGPSALKRDSKTDFVSLAPDEDSGWSDRDIGCEYMGGPLCFCTNPNREAGCNYVYPMNPKDDAYRLKYKIIWKQPSLRVHEENPATARVVDA